MSSKAKSGLSAGRQFPEKILEPPNAFTPGATTFVSSIRDGRGHSEYHVAATNTTGFTLKVLHSWRSTGPFVLDQTIAAIADPETTKFVANIIAPISRRYIKIHVVAVAPGFNVTDFELGGYFLPRPSGHASTSGAGGTGKSGTVITTGADTTVAVAATVVLPSIPVGTRRMTVEVTDGDATTRVRIREVGGLAGSGKLLSLLGSTVYGGVDGAIAAIEAQNVVGPTAKVMVQFERD
jgi:hypothetical protein